MRRPVPPRVTRFEHAFHTPAAPETAFDFFADARNLDRVTPGWFRFEILTPLPIVMRLGLCVDYRLRWRLLSFHWRSLVTEWDPPRLFTYEQARGPYRYFRHEHHFAADGAGTRVLDRVMYRAPGGGLVHRCLVAPDLRRIFRHRERAAGALLE